MGGGPDSDRRRGAEILVIDDDPILCDLVDTTLARWGHSVITAADAAGGLRLFYARRPDLVVLDVDLPEVDGWEVLGRIRELSEVPVLMLTAKQAELDKVRALRGGADDFLIKPFGRQELPARIEALLRRARARGDEEQEIYADGRLEVDLRQRLARSGGRELSLTPLEFRLLAAFVRNHDQILSPDQLLELAWQDSFVRPEQVKLYVGRLRRKLDDPEAIETVRGFGYRYRSVPT